MRARRAEGCVQRGHPLDSVVSERAALARRDPEGEAEALVPLRPDGRLPSIWELIESGAWPDWPEPPAEAAYHGVLGDIARAVAPHTEADPVGVLGTLLAMFGAACGGSRSLYQGSLQRTNLSVLLVGETGFGGRKGTALDVVPERVPAGLPGPRRRCGSSASRRARRSPATWPATSTAGRGTRPRSASCIVEPEFGRLLTIMNREGSTLSAVLRNAWDGVPLGHARARDESLVTRHHVVDARPRHPGRAAPEADRHRRGQRVRQPAPVPGRPADPAGRRSREPPDDARARLRPAAPPRRSSRPGPSARWSSTTPPRTAGRRSTPSWR